ncbi:hypothetical protein D9Q98_007286 [Chlorella vulgaris]|uniref:DNA (cytosine-5-)-methyltransferase n=1 Tax=Chlorella vulgaris TaxID=3077 RepID=A0A9D4YVQ8_CHLVU|nr:hypothetical protein D9Q98_007286 [Chlorella vulgaris]
MTDPHHPTTFCEVEDCRGLTADHGGFRWLGAPIPKAEVKRQYPSREQVDLVGCKSEEQRRTLVARCRAASEKLARQAKEPFTFHPPAAAHFWGFWADEESDGAGDHQHVYVGDFIKVDVGDDNTKGWSVAQIEELYQTGDGKRMMRLLWFYAAHDTDTSLVYAKKRGAGTAAGDDEAEGSDSKAAGGQKKKKAAAENVVYKMAVDDFDERQLFCARDNILYPHEYEIGALECKVDVLYVRPGEQPPADCQFWWTFEFDRRYLTFEVPPHIAREQLAEFLADRAGKGPLVLRGMDLYVGAGGLGYLDHVSLNEDSTPDVNGVQLRTDWACDYEEDMGQTFKANNQHCHVFISGTDEHLELCKATYELAQELKMQCDGQPALPWNGRDPYQACDDDQLLAWPRSVEADVIAKRRVDGRRAATLAAAAKRRKLGNGAAAAAAAAILEGGEEEGGSGELDEEMDGFEDDETLAAGPSSGPAAKGRSKGKDELHLTEADCLPYHGKIGKVLEIKQMRLGERAPRQRTSNVSCGLLERFIRRDERWLEFKVVMEGGEGQQEEVWLSRKQLKGREKLLTGFVRRLRERQCIPFPAEVDFICGGPPCQGISGNNRHAITEDILQDPRNRQLPVFIAYAEWFKPKYVLMENVQDILKKEDGLYIKYAMGSMLNMRYQVRVGMLAAGNFGVPQGRWRCFMWAAAPGQQLPAIPKPTHNCVDFQCPIAANAKRITSGFENDAEAAELGCMPVLLGDIFSDLPEVDNFELHERQLYKSWPQRVTQAWLRRDPQPWMTSREDRFQAHEKCMHKGHNELVRSALQMAEEQGATVMGTKILFCQKNPLAPLISGAKRALDDTAAGNHAFETWAASVRHVRDSKIQAVLWLQAEASRAGYAHTLGTMYMQRLRQYLELDPVLRSNPEATLCDHRPYFCNADDHLRMLSVPQREPGAVGERNFRSLEGIVVGPNGTCCSGHSHAPRINGKSDCSAGGVYEPPAREQKGARKEYRVDQHNKGGWRGGALEGCSAATVFMPTGDVLVPQWCITFKGGHSDGRGGCYGRQGLHEIVATVVGRSEPHNLKVGHPTQARTTTIRENARMQGFPDYHVLLAKPKTSTSRFIRNPNLTQRFQQMGNAVCPQVAAALGRCLALASLHQTPSGAMLVSVPDPEYQALVDDWTVEMIEQPGLPSGFYAEEYGMARLKWLDNFVQFLKEGSDVSETVNCDEEGEEEDAAPATGKRRAAPKAKAKAKPKQQRQQQQLAEPTAVAPAPPAAMDQDQASDLAAEEDEDAEVEIAEEVQAIVGDEREEAKFVEEEMQVEEEQEVQVVQAQGAGSEVKDEEEEEEVEDEEETEASEDDRGPGSDEFASAYSEEEY